VTLIPHRRTGWRGWRRGRESLPLDADSLAGTGPRFPTSSRRRSFGASRRGRAKIFESLLAAGKIDYLYAFRRRSSLRTRRHGGVRRPCPAIRSRPRT
jgi:hypothetical protein